MTINNLEERKCKDGSYTFYKKDVDECYHSPIGAAREAREKYVKPTELLKRVKNNEINILDVCYGLGYNSAAAIEEIKKKKNNNDKQIEINIVGLENDTEIIEKSLDIPFPFNCKKIFKKLIQNHNEKKNTYEAKEENTEIKIIIGDAKKTIKKIEKNKYNVVFYDPFSPKKEPTLWTEKFMKEVYEKMGENSILVTYSCARMIRDNLRKAGFEVKDGPIVGRRGPATIAIKKQNNNNNNNN